MWDLHGHMVIEGTRVNAVNRNKRALQAKSQEKELLGLGDYIFPSFCGLTIALLTLATPWFLRLD